MKIVAKSGNEQIATVYIARMKNGQYIEFVESVQPPIPKREKWVLIVSTLYGCPVGCRFCDAGNFYRGKLSPEEILDQIDHMILNSYPDRRIPASKFKIQFARMGEPSLNTGVLSVLEEMPGLFHAPGLLPTGSTVAPHKSDLFLSRLLEIKNRIYKEKFQLQFSVHSTDEKQRDWLMPVKKWRLEKISEFGGEFYREGERKITLNFALAEGISVVPAVLTKYFDPEIFFIKLTPVNPTARAVHNSIVSRIVPDIEDYPIIGALEDCGYDVLLSIGELEENHIGSNCGQHIMNFIKEKKKIIDGYTYALRSVASNK